MILLFLCLIFQNKKNKWPVFCYRMEEKKTLGKWGKFLRGNIEEYCRERRTQKRGGRGERKSGRCQVREEIMIKGTFTSSQDG